MNLLLIALLAAGLISAQTTTRRSAVLALGDGSVAVTPDQAKINLAVVTQAQTAQAAADQNATVAANVIAQIRALLGSNGDVKTVSYYLSPLYNNSNPPAIIGYSASNTIMATANEISFAARIIDTGIAAGASRIDSLQFGLKDDSAAKSAALKSATARAKAKAEAMAAALNLRLGNVIVLQEGGAVVQTPGVAGTAASTPIVAGSVNVTANVAIEFELIP